MSVRSSARARCANTPPPTPTIAPQTTLNGRAQFSLRFNDVAVVGGASTQCKLVVGGRCPPSSLEWAIPAAQLVAFPIAGLQHGPQQPSPATVVSVPTTWRQSNWQRRWPLLLFVIVLCAAAIVAAALLATGGGDGGDGGGGGVASTAARRERAGGLSFVVTPLMPTDEPPAQLHRVMRDAVRGALPHLVDDCRVAVFDGGTVGDLEIDVACQRKMEVELSVLEHVVSNGAFAAAVGVLSGAGTVSVSQVTKWRSE